MRRFAVQLRWHFGVAAETEPPIFLANIRHLPRPLLGFYLGGAVAGPIWFWIKERSAMETKPAQNIQDTFLNTARKDKSLITIYLMSGVKLSGRIRSFDKYSVVLETNSQEQLIFKHAISTVVIARGSHHAERPAGEHRPPTSERQPGAAPHAEAGSGSAASEG
jgi:host factor-I protein